MFALEIGSVILDIKDKLFQKINSELNMILVKDQYSLQGINVEWNEAEIEVDGYDYLKSESFVLFYNYKKGTGKLHYLDGEKHLI